MRHLKSGKKLNRTASHRNATLRALASALFEHKRIHTTEAKAKALRPYAEKLISRAKNAIKNEQSGNIPQGQNVDVHSRRVVYKEIKNKEVLQELFDSIAPVVIERNGGYTRIVKTGFRRGDAAKTAIIELVDWSSDQDASFQKSSTPKKKKEDKVEEPAVAEEATEEVEETPESAKEEEAEAVAETVEEATEEVADESAEEETTTKDSETDTQSEEAAEETSEDTKEKAEASEEVVEEETAEEEKKEKSEETSETEESKEEDNSDDTEEEKKD